MSEQVIVADSDLCTNPSNYTDTQLRADYTNCGLPEYALVKTGCVEGITNEPTNCGFGNSTIGLCQYCGSGGSNPTDTCCSSSQASTRCLGVVLPSISTSAILTATSTSMSTTSTATSASNSTATSASTTSTSSDAAEGMTTVNSRNGLSGGAIAGIVVGSVAGLVLLLLAILLCCRRRRKRNGEPNEKGPAVAVYNHSDGSGSSIGRPPSEYDVLSASDAARYGAPPAGYSIPPFAAVDPNTQHVAGISGAQNHSDSSFRQAMMAAAVGHSSDEDNRAGGRSRRSSLAPSEYLVLPGGRRVRRVASIHSTDDGRGMVEQFPSPPQSDTEEVAPSVHPELAAGTAAAVAAGAALPAGFVASHQRSTSAAQSEYTVLPGGRRVRTSMSVVDTDDGGGFTSRPTSSDLPRAPSSSKLTKKRGSTVAKKVASKAASLPPAPSNIDDFEILPGGRMVRKSGLAGFVGGSSALEQMYESEPSTSKAPESQEITASAAAEKSPDTSPDIPAAAIEDATALSMSRPPISMPSSGIKDYYSPEYICPGDKVAAVWSYESRTKDEFALERGDILQVTSIWGDGWAIGFRVKEPVPVTVGSVAGGSEGQSSAVAASSQSTTGTDGSNGEVKAFPLVCVCLATYSERVFQAGGMPVSAIEEDDEEEGNSSENSAIAGRS